MVYENFNVLIQEAPLWILGEGPKGLAMPVLGIICKTPVGYFSGSSSRVKLSGSTNTPMY